MENEALKWLQEQSLACKDHKSYRRGCPSCRLDLDTKRAVENATRSEVRRQKVIKAQLRDKFEKRIQLAEEENRRWKPNPFDRCKLKAHKGVRCRCQDLNRETFDTLEEQQEFVEEQRRAIKALGI